MYAGINGTAHTVEKKDHPHPGIHPVQMALLFDLYLAQVPSVITLIFVWNGKPEYAKFIFPYLMLLSILLAIAPTLGLRWSFFTINLKTMA